VAIEGTITLVEGVVGLYGKLTLACLSLSLAPSPEDGQRARPGRPPPRQSGKVTRAWRSSVDVLSRDHSTDLGLGRPLVRGRGPRLQLTGRPVGTVGLDGLEKIMVQETARLINV
jgi:hypothetical protein